MSKKPELKEVKTEEKKIDGSIVVTLKVSEKGDAGVGITFDPPLPANDEEAQKMTEHERMRALMQSQVASVISQSLKVQNQKGDNDGE